MIEKANTLLFMEEIYVNKKESFLGMENEDLDLQPVFCVSVYGADLIRLRKPMLTYIAKKRLNIETIQELLEKKIYIIRRIIDQSGNYTNKYNAKQATVTNISNIGSTFSYSEIGTLSERGSEQISLSRIFCTP